MEPKSGDHPSWRSAALAALLSAGAGSGIGWLTWQSTGSSALGIGIAGPMALLSNNMITQMLLKGKK